MQKQETQKMKETLILLFLTLMQGHAKHTIHERRKMGLKDREGPGKKKQTEMPKLNQHCKYVLI